MADTKHAFDIDIGTAVDMSGLEKGLSDVEKEVLKSAAEQLEIIEKNAYDQIRAVKDAEAEKVAEVKKSIGEQIAAVKATEGLDSAAKQEQINAIKDRETAKIAAIKEGAKLEESVIKDTAKKQIKTVQDSTKKQLEALKDYSKKGIQTLKDFAKGAAGSLAGLDQVLAAVAGGPVAIGKLTVDLAKKAVAALDEMAASWREQEQAEVALLNAAKNNPYLNDRSVKQLTSFANEMQRLTGIDSVQVLQTEKRLASLQRNQEQIKKIISTATDMAAAGVMTYDEAVNELNNSYNGMIRTSGKLYPELKNLSAEALASGEAIDIIAGKVSGSAAEAMKTGAGSVTAYKNAWDNLKKAWGEDWERVTRGARDALTRYIERVAAAKNESNDLRKALEEIRKGAGTSATYETAFSLELKRVEEALEATRAASQRTSILGGIKAAINDNYAVEIERLEGLIQVYRQRVEIADQLAEIEEEINRKVAAAARFSEIEGTLEAQENLNTALRHQANILNDIQSAYVALERNAVDIAQSKLSSGFIESEARALNVITDGIEETLRLRERQVEIEAGAKRFREENEKALKAEEERIYRRAELEGKSIDDLEVQKQILDANVQAYENLLSAAREYIDGTAPEEQQRLADLKERWQIYQNLADEEKFNDEVRKKNLQELASRQNELDNELRKIYEDVQGEARRQAEIAEEREHQAKIAELRKVSLEAALEYEAQVERDRRNRAYEERLAEIEEWYKELEDKNRELWETEIAQHAEGSARRLAIDEEYNENKIKLEEQRVNTIEQMELNLAAEIENIDKNMTEALKQDDDDLLDHRLKNIQDFLSACQQIASNISATWGNIIDYQLNEELRKNDEIIQSDEERAKKEKELTMEAAKDKYKADLFAWSANVTMATAQAAMAVLNQMTQGDPYTATARALAAGVLGAAQVAAVASAIPKPPRFHEGGIVQGRAGQEVPAVLMAGEPVLTQAQFTNTMEAISNLAKMRTGGGEGVKLNLKIENNAGDVAKAQFDPDTMRVTIEKITADAIASGRMNAALAGREYNLRGADFQ